MTVNYSSLVSSVCTAVAFVGFIVIVAYVRQARRR